MRVHPRRRIIKGVFSMTWLAVKLLFGGFIKRAIEALSALFRFARDNPWRMVAIVAVMACGWLWQARNAERAKVSDITAVLISERLATEAAQVQAKAKQAALDNRTAETFRSISERIEYAAREYEGAFVSAADRYANANRVRRQGAGGASCGPAAPGVHPDPAAPFDGQADAELVAVTRPDFDALTGQAMQNAERGGFLTALVDAGLAVPDVGF
jgi:hypothetical protein